MGSLFIPQLKPWILSNISRYNNDIPRMVFLQTISWIPEFRHGCHSYLFELPTKITHNLEGDLYQPHGSSETYCVTCLTCK